MQARQVKEMSRRTSHVAWRSNYKFLSFGARTRAPARQIRKVDRGGPIHVAETACELPFGSFKLIQIVVFNLHFFHLFIKKIIIKL